MKPHGEEPQFTIEDLLAEIRSMAQDSPGLSNEEIAERLGISRQQAAKILRGLIREGKVVVG